jgi:hypothetical protein
MIRVELVFVHSDGQGGKTYELKFVDDDGMSSSCVKVYADGSMELDIPKDDDAEVV